MHQRPIRGGVILWIISGALAAQSGSQPQYMNISFGSLFSGGWSSAESQELLVLQGGAHDPRQRGFTVQNLELSFMGAVDPFLNGEIHLIFQIDEAGESLIEVEEAFVTSRALPAGLQAKAGTFFTEFGRLNPQHPHSWSFVDQPIINSRMFGGDGLRGAGARLAWLSPLPWYSEIFLGLQNAKGETAFSFLSSAEAVGIGGYPPVEREVSSLSDLLRSSRWLNSVSLGRETTMNLGASALWGPNSTGDEGATSIYGLDLYLKWKRLANDQGWPFVALQAEAMSRNYQVAANPAEKLSAGSLEDRGWYAQLLWGFRRGWVAAGRHEQATSSDTANEDPLRDQRTRLAGNVSYYPSEFSKLRLQINLDRAAHLENAWQWGVWLQFAFLLGQHGGHKF